MKFAGRLLRLFPDGKRVDLFSGRLFLFIPIDESRAGRLFVEGWDASEGFKISLNQADKIMSCWESALENDNTRSSFISDDVRVHLIRHGEKFIVDVVTFYGAHYIERSLDDAELALKRYEAARLSLHPA